MEPVLGTQFVKFVRGTPASWQALPDNKKLNNVLYFICEEGATTGKLYLGKVLIGDGVSDSNIGNVSITNPSNRDLLSYDATTETWTNTPVIDAINTFNGTTSGLVPTVSDGDENKFLCSDGTWATVPTSSFTGVFDDKEFSLKNNKLYLLNFSEAEDGAILQKTDGEISWTKFSDLVSDQFYTKDDIDEKLSNLTGLSKTIVNSIDDINLEQTGASNNIYLVPNENGTETNGYSEYLVINKDGVNSLEKVGDWEIDLANYVKTEDLEAVVKTQVESLVGDTIPEGSKLGDMFVLQSVYSSEVGDIDQLLIRDIEGKEDATVVDSINYLTQLLSWQSIDSNN